jgi:prepilin-type N-terminal cleavage/methylation domain-containing protein/prepilin-type processing-associated H-X9-DG protein
MARHGIRREVSIHGTDCHSPRAAFSLVEMLVVMTIIAGLAAMLLPAVQQARETARQAWCRHNLARLAESMIRHESILGYYPSAGWSPEWLGVANRPGDASQPGGWAFNTLSYIDARRVRDIAAYAASTTTSNGQGSGKGNTGTTGGGNDKQLDAAIHAAYTQLANNSLGVFNCPSRRTSKPVRVDAAMSFRTPASTLLSLSTATRTDYAVNGGAAGVCPPLPWFAGRAVSPAVIAQANTRIKKIEICHCPPGNPENGKTHNLPYQSIFDEGHSNHPDDLLGGCDTCYRPIDETIFTPASLVEGDAWTPSPLEIRFALSDMGVPDLQDGLFQRMAVLRSSHTVDGMTMTYMVGEKYVSAGNYQTGRDSGDKAVLFSGYSSSNIRWAFERPRPDAADEHPNAFGSAHEDGFNMAYADGSVRTIGYDVDPALHKSMASRNDGSMQ